MRNFRGGGFEKFSGGVGGRNFMGVEIFSGRVGIFSGGLRRIFREALRFFRKGLRFFRRD